MNDTIKKQHNYLTPESVQVTKGSNAIVSYIHHYLSNYSSGEKNLYKHADNCVGQNKNNIVIGYLVWRVINNLNAFITFLPAGHTKFGCDWAFGLLKKNLSKASSLSQIEEIVADSTPTPGLNKTVKTGT